MPTSFAPDGRRARKRRQTADHLLQTAFDLFAAHGYDNVTMEQIAARADVAKGTLYNHYPVKEALLRDRFHADLGAALPGLFAQMQALPGCVARLRAFLHANAAYSERFKDYLAHYIHYRLSQPLAALAREERSGLDQVYAQLLAEGQASGEISSTLSAQHLASYFQFMHLCILLHWLQTPGASLVAEFDAMLDLFLDGARSGRQP
jgi:AcrR family transcriptional regulator